MAPGWIAGLVLGIFCATTTSLQAQTETPQTPQDTLTPAEEEDYSQYDNIGFAAEGAKRYCSPKIEGLSPAKLISIGYDYQMGYTMKADTFRRLGSLAPLMPDSARVLTSNGMRFGCNIPVISRTDLVWQMGANYWEQRYKFEDPAALKSPMLTSANMDCVRWASIQPCSSH